MPNYIAQNGLGFSVIEETTFGVTPTTGVRYDLPTSVGQGPLVSTISQIESDTQRPNLERAAPSNGHGSSSGTLSMRFRACEAVDLLIQSAIAGRFDENGLAFGEEEDIFFSLITKLTNKNGFMGYADAGLSVTNWNLSGSAREGVSCSFDVIGSKRTRLNADHPLSVTVAGGRGFVYGDVKNVTVAGQTLDFVNFDFSTGVPQDHRIVLGQQNATSIAKTGNRETTLNLQALRTSFAVDALINGTPVPVTLSVVDALGDSYRITLPAAVCTSPTDELSDTGLLINLDFTAYEDPIVKAGITVEKL